MITIKNPKTGNDVTFVNSPDAVLARMLWQKMEVATNMSYAHALQALLDEYDPE